MFFSAIIFFTYKGLGQELNNQYNDLIIALASILGTIIAIFFTLVIFPIQQISNKYSHKFSAYILKDRKFYLYFCFFSIVLIYYLFFVFYGSSKLIAIMSLLFFLLSLLALWDLIRHVIKISNPVYSILQPAYRMITKEIDNSLSRFYRQCVKDFDSYGHLEISGSELCKTKVDSRIIKYIERQLLPIREIAAKSIRDMDLETAEYSIGTMASVVSNYFEKRRDYQDEQDPILMFIQEELGILSNIGSKEINLRLHPTIIDSWVQIGIQISRVKLNKKSMSPNFNALAYWPIKALKDLCIKNFADYDSYAPSKACSAMGDIGVQLMIEGYDNQAAEVVKELSTLSIIAIKSNLSHITNSANYAIMKIYYVGLANRNEGSYDSFNHPYKEINEKINEVILAGLAKEKLTVFDNQIFAPFFGYTSDIFTCVNFERVSESALFTEGLSEYSLEMNLRCLEANIATLNIVLIKLKEHKDSYFSGQALDNLYLMILHLLSFVNRSMAKDHILYYEKQKPKILTNQKLQDQAQEIMTEAIDNLIRYALEKFDEHIFESTNLKILFSLFFIILHENKINRKIVLDNLYNDFEKKLLKLLSDYKKSSASNNNDELYKYYRLLKAVLSENNKLKQIGNKIIIPKYQYSTDFIASSFNSEYPETLIGDSWILKRPIFQVNTFYFNKVEKALKLDQLHF